MSSSAGPRQPRTVTDPPADTGVMKRGFAILDALVEAARPLSAREIAEATGLNDSTAHRLIQTLCETGYAVRDGSRRYRAAGRAFLPLTIYHPLNVLRRDAFETLRSLRESSGMTASIAAFLGFERVVVDVSGVAGSLTPYYRTCMTNPLHVSAAGKLLLSSLPQAEREALLGPGPYPALTPHTLTDPDTLARNLAEVVECGFATNLNENFVGLSAIAAPLAGGGSKYVGCLMLAGASERLTEDRIADLGRTLINSANLIALGSPAIRALRALAGS